MPPRVASGRLSTMSTVLCSLEEEGVPPAALVAFVMDLQNQENRQRDPTVRKLEEIRTFVLKSNQLDIAFLVDVTASMRPSIEMVRNKVQSIAENILKTYPAAQIRVAFVGYRDYDDAERTIMRDFTSYSTVEAASFKAWVDKVEAGGGADEAEDVFSGLEAVAKLNWASTNRLLLHIADAPCHGTEFNGGVRDSYAAGDKFKRNISAILSQLRTETRIQSYYFAQLNQSTQAMVARFKTLCGDDQWLQAEMIDNVGLIPLKIATLAKKTISMSMSGGMNGHQPRTVIQLEVVSEPPSWAGIQSSRGSVLRVAIEDMSEAIDYLRQKKPLPFVTMYTANLKIAPHPFSKGGSNRWPFYAQLKTKNADKNADYVVKRFKAHVGDMPDKVHSRRSYEEQAEIQAIAWLLAGDFNLKVKTAGVESRNVAFSMVSVLEVEVGEATTVYNMEKKLFGQFDKYNNNGGGVNIDANEPILQAFSHWTHTSTGGVLMVTDIQGVKPKTQQVFWLSDPAIHCSADILRFGGTNLGTAGYNAFFGTHECNAICKALKLEKHPKHP